MQSNAEKQTRLKGKGWFVNEHDVIYVQGSVKLEGWAAKKFVRKSWGKRATKGNITYIQKHHRDVLLQILEEEKDPLTKLKTFEDFSRMVIEDGAKKRDKNGKESNRGRGELAQRDALSKLENYILPFFKRYTLEEIKPMHIETWIAGILREKSSSTASKCKNLMSEIMHTACGNDLIMKNPVEYVKKIEISYEKQGAYSLKDTLKMMRESTGWMHTYLNLAFTTGMRTGELLALRWEDIDWEHSCIYLQRSVTKGRIKIGSVGQKNHYRIVPILPGVLDILKLAYQNSRKEWVFPARHGSYYCESKSIVKSHFKPLLERLGIQYISLYATRHTFATIAENHRVNSMMLDSMVGNSEKVRNEHYVTFEMTTERSQEAQRHLDPVNNIFFDDKKADVR